VSATPCALCGYLFDADALGAYGCPNCLGEGLDDTLDGACPPCSQDCDQGDRCPRRVPAGGRAVDMLLWLFWPVYAVCIVALGVALWRGEPWW